MFMLMCSQLRVVFLKFFTQPLLQVKALTLTAHLSELIEDWQVAVLARCSLSGVMSTLGMLDEASVILYKCKQHVTNSSDDQLYLQCCLFKAQIFLYLVQDNVSTLFYD